MRKHAFLLPFLILLQAFILWSCGPRLSSRASEYLFSVPETSLCTQEFSYANGLPLTGSAKFFKRSTDIVTEVVGGTVKIKSMVLSDPIASPLPIQNAEVAVYDRKYKLVQCGATDSTGALKDLRTTGDLIVPNTAQNYYVRVLARSNYNYGTTDSLSVSIKKDRYRNEVYYLETVVSSNGSTVSSADMLAYARQTDSMQIEGGAFNILNNIQQSYDYIKSSTVGIDTDCLNTKLNIYWRAGFNPMQYLSPGSDASTLANTSYYLQETNELYITGGQLGDVSLANTDHFDDFATIHELGHFLEKNCGQFTSPGGSHAITVRIDPRLAWSEGWANYFATQVLNSRMSYIDPTMATKLTAANENVGWTFFFNSSGFNDSFQNIMNAQGFMIDFKRPGTDPGEYTFAPYTGLTYDKVNPLLYKGEGHTREGAISRGLYKITNNCGANCITGAVIPFANLWKSFDQITGIGSAYSFDYTPFVGSHAFIEKLLTFGGNVDASNVLGKETLHTLASDFTVSGRLAWTGYGKKLSPGGCTLSIEPRIDDPSLTGSNSDQRYSNHYYTLDLANLPGLTQISVQFSKSAGSDVDHDLLIFKPDYSFNDDYRCTNQDASGTCTGTWVAQRTTNADVVLSDRASKSPLTSYTKTITGINNLDSSKMYMLNIRSYTANKSIGSTTSYQYTINSNLGQLCP